MLNRIKILEEFLEEEPNDAFTLYALALEYLVIDSEKSYTIFKNLVDNHSNYVPTYYQFGSLLQSLNKMDEAEIIYQKGIEMALLVKDFHTLSELKSALINMQIDNDDE